MILIGLTGQTGAGKSTVTTMLRQQGFAVIDADACSHEATVPGAPCLPELCEAFGDDLLDKGGVLNRALLASRAFSDPVNKDKLEKIIFPFIIENINRKLALLEGKGYRLVILDAPTLFESGIDAMCNRVISVTASEEQRLERILKRDGVSREQALLRMSAQKSEEFYRTHSRHIIENSGSEDELKKQVDELVALLTEVEGCQNGE